MEEYAGDDKLSEYLVDGAVLRCTGATTDDVYGVTLCINKGADSETARLRTTLNVSENPASVNGLTYATTRDTVQNENLIPLFNTEMDGSGMCYEEGASGEYYLITKNVTPIMSIGMAVDKFQDLLEKNQYQYDVALKKYNIGNPNYVREVTERVRLGDDFVGD